MPIVPFSFVHAADLHLGTPFVGLHEVSARVAERLREATFESFDRVVNACLEYQADFLVVAGDIYNSQDRSLRAQLHFRDGLKKLSDDKIPAFVAHGNHDPLDGWSARIQWPKSVHFFGGDSVERQVVMRGKQALAQVYGVSHQSKDVRDNLALAFHRGTDDGFALSVLHCNLGGDTGHEAYAACNLVDLKNAGMDYWALGHVHGPRVVCDSSPVVVYAGCSQGQSPRDTGQRGCYLVCVDADGTISLRFIATDVVRWCCESISIDGIDDEDGLVQGIESLCEKALGEAEGRDVICRVVIEGRGPMHRMLRRLDSVDDIVRHLRNEFEESQPFIWLESLEDQTRPPIDIDALRTSQGFVGDLLRLSDQLRNDPGKVASLLSDLQSLYSSSGGRRFLAEPTDADLIAWLASAEAKCLDLLIAEDA